MIDVFPIIIYFHRRLRIVFVPDKLKRIEEFQDPEFQVSLERGRVKSKKSRPFGAGQVS
ncbi:hypothetical protein LEP1GSC193_0099 [Leptospira alstonii serovar Pingchang str. 80-412]|uniref:Uncharacterized protein n=2 Tax=Leptospira alstonii TaxID=28452 RepID=M6CQ41_9LEPT|nr:hypothetical protein LEP1GSC194_1247 [Leptospira alstonii serovar Sichuan str. 79601]EQA78303.1 hypothetical protein LEP1GSC193_0099 [Leptospira alstonii serovar Pingchang str. 80-412]